MNQRCLPIFFEKSYLDESVIFLCTLFLKLIWEYILSLSPSLARKVIPDLNSFKASAPDFILEGVLKIYEGESSYIFGNIFNLCLKEPNFLISFYFRLIYDSSAQDFCRKVCTSKLLPCKSFFFVIHKLITIGLGITLTNVAFLDPQC